MSVCNRMSSYKQPTNQNKGRRRERLKVLSFVNPNVIDWLLNPFDLSQKKPN